MFQVLPHEVLDQIMVHSSSQDKWNLAKTCSQLLNAIKPLIWREMKITNKHLLSTQMDSFILENLQHTQKLDIDAKLEPTIPTDCIRFGYNMSSLMHAINPLNLRKLTLKGACSDNLLYSMKHLSSLQELHLQHIANVEDVVWNHACLPNGVEVLGILSCSVPNEFIHAVVRSCKVLQTLIIWQCNRLTGPCLVALHGAMKLAYLGIYKIGSPGYKFDVSSLADIPSLIDLRIGAIGMTENSFARLLNKCSQLTGLELMEMDTNAQEFSGMHQLQNLTEISVLGCPAIKASTFLTAISSLEASETMEFDVEMFSENDNVDDTKRMISLVNRMPYLETINLCYDQRKNSDICLQIVSALCWGDKVIWKTKVNKKGQKRVLTLCKV